jgi:multidrug efflux pump
MVVHLLSPNDRYDMTYLRNYAVLNVKDRLARIDGVGEVQLMWGAGDYSMRVWVDPQKAAEHAPDGERRGARDPARRTCEAAAGVVGASPERQGLRPAALGQCARAGCQSEEEFGEIVVKSGAAGEVVRLKDVARIELGASEYALRCAARQQAGGRDRRSSRRPGSNALEISDHVRKATMAEMKKPTCRKASTYQIVYDPTPFVRSSIEAVVHTLLEAVVLVVLVVILFLQTWRASVIPLDRGACVDRRHVRGDACAFGFSINALSRCSAWCWPSASWSTTPSSWWRMSSATSKRACRRAMRPIRRCREVSGPIIAIALVSDRGVRAAGLHLRSDRAVLQAVRADDCDLDRDLGDQLADVVAGAVGAAAEGHHDAPKDWLTRMMERSLRLAVPGLQQGLHQVDRRATARSVGRKVICRARRS